MAARHLSKPCYTERALVHDQSRAQGPCGLRTGKRSQACTHCVRNVLVVPKANEGCYLTWSTPVN